MAAVRELLDMETEFRAMNVELEAKTEQLMRKADDVVKNQENSIYDFVNPEELNKNFNEMSSAYYYNSKPSQRFNSTLQHANWKSIESDNNYAEENSKFDEGNRIFNDRIDEIVKKDENIDEMSGFDDKTKQSFMFPARILSGIDYMPDLKRSFDFKHSADSSIDHAISEDLNDVDENIENIMKTLKDQKEFSKTIDGLLKTKDFVKKRTFQNVERHKMADKLDKSKMAFNNESVANFETKSFAEDAMVKALKFKIDMLQGELMRCQEQLKKKSAECCDVGKKNAALEEGRVKMAAQVNAMRNSCVKLEAKIAGLNSKIQLKETECRTLRADKEAINKVAKDAVQNNSGVEARLARGREEVQSLRESLSVAKVQEKEVRETAKKQIDELTASLSRSEKRGACAVKAVKKQAQLLDNLRRQLAIAQGLKMAKSAEDKLDDVLSWQCK